MTKKKAVEMTLSDQAIGSIMMALQRAILEQTDVTTILQGLTLRLSETGLVVMNPPIVKFSELDEEADELTE